MHNAGTCAGAQGPPSVQGDGSYVMVSDGASSRDECDFPEHADAGGNGSGLGAVAAELLTSPPVAGLGKHAAEDADDKENAHRPGGNAWLANGHSGRGAQRSLFEDGDAA